MRTVSLLLAALLLSDPVVTGTEVNGAATLVPIAFNRDVRPILSDHCWQCHGPDEAARKADLRLDLLDDVLAERRSGIHAVVAGDVDASELIYRIETDDIFDRMPPSSANLELSADEIEVLKRWVAEGADWEAHWAFEPPVGATSPPVSRPDWVRDPLDAFVLARLDDAGLSPSAEADRETLIRRVSFDLTGLPPSLSEIDRYLADETPGAYERVVDRLLASPHYGERQAAVWLDAARYADTHGYHHDDFRSMWPWRDWVVNSFNSNQPFDRFVIEQLAGDLLEDPTDAQLIATGFNRNHGITDEGGALDAEYRVEYVADRVATTSTVFLGLTLECARCHDHKFDPFSQEDYYGLYAFFNSIDEQGVPPRNASTGFAFAPKMRAPTPQQREQLEQAEAQLASLHAEREAPDPAAEDDFAAWQSGLAAAAGLAWEQSAPHKLHSEAGAELVLLDDGSVLAQGENPDTDVHVLSYRTDATDLSVLRLDALTHESLAAGAAGRAPNGNAVLTGLSLTAVSVLDPDLQHEVRFGYAWADHAQGNGDFDIFNLLDGSGEGWAIQGHDVPGPRVAFFVAEQPFGFEGGTELELTLRYESRYTQHTLGRVAAAFSPAHDVLSSFPAVESDWWVAGPFASETADRAYAAVFGPELVHHIDKDDLFGADGLRWVHRPDFIDGETHELVGERSAFFVGRTIWTSTARSLMLSLGSDDAIRVYHDGRNVLSNDTRRGVAPDQESLQLDLHPGSNVLVAKIVNEGGPAGFYYRAEALGEVLSERAPFALQPLALTPLEQRTESAAVALFDDWRRNASPAYLALSERIADAESQLLELEAQVPVTQIMRELDMPNPTFVLTRGAYDAPDESRPVQRSVPVALGRLPDDASADRLGLARWMVDADNPLVARVAVNRFWQIVFGTGLLATQENFGSRAQAPSHPELLDRLAVDFRESGWDVKGLVRRLVTSATYRQSSKLRPDLSAQDPDNRLLARGSRGRLSAEMVRDQGLAASGLLVRTLGGPSVKTYQPPGLWAERAIPSSNTKLFEGDTGEKLYRRSLYTFWKRSAPPPQMSLFDAPEREFCVVQRGSTNTPLQALVLMNDEAWLETARNLAQRVLSEAGGDSEAFVTLLRLATGRSPDEQEQSLLSAALADYRERYEAAPDDAMALLAYGESEADPSIEPPELAAWTLLASAVLNLHETITKD